MPAGEKERIALRRKDAIRLRVEGNTYAEIGEQLGVSQGQAFADVKAVIEAARTEANEAANEAIDVELRRLDIASRLALREVQAGNLSAIDKLVKTQERRAKLLGLDSPERHEVSTDLELSPAKVRELAAEAFGRVTPEELVGDAPADSE